MRCSLKWTCKTLRTTGQCCSLCSLRHDCKDACLNDPARCVMSREATPMELVFQYGIRLVKRRGEYEQIAETGQPLGMFYAKVWGSFEAMDNRTGVPITQDGFATSDEAIAWLAQRAEADMKEG